MPGAKQAVVVIHGMGEQKPMGTLRSFVETIWQKDKSLGRKDLENVYWIKPDDRVGLQELRRITTEGDKRGVRTDFYEFYWADLMQGTTWQHVSSWLSGLLFRSPATVPWNVFFVWIVLWFISIFTGLVVLSTVDKFGIKIGKCDLEILGWGCKILNIPADLIEWAEPILNSGIWIYLLVPILMLVVFIAAQHAWPAFKHLKTWVALPFFVLVVIVGTEVLRLIAATDYFAAATMAAVLFLLNRFMVPYVGDVARYVQASPANVERRKAVRDRGMQLLRALHEDDGYQRIIVVSHSLGSIIAYDLINQLWSENGPSKRNPPSSVTSKALADMDGWLGRVHDKKELWDLDIYRAHQRKISRALADPGKPAKAILKTSGQITKPWLISDLVTVGSPLTHAEFLLARDDKGFRKLMRERVLSTSPPFLEADTRRNCQTFRYRDPTIKAMVPHHASCFAAVRWTNIYDSHNCIAFLLGDVVSGRVQENFGKGIVEEPVRIWRGTFGIPRLFTHTEYWNWRKSWDDQDPPHHIQCLRNAVNLMDLDGEAS